VDEYGEVREDAMSFPVLIQKAVFFLVKYSGEEEPFVLLTLETGAYLGEHARLRLPEGDRAGHIARVYGLNLELSDSLTSGMWNRLQVEKRTYEIRIVSGQIDFAALKNAVVNLDNFTDHFSFSPSRSEPEFRVCAVRLSQAIRIGDPLLLSALALFQARKTTPSG